MEHLIIDFGLFRCYIWECLHLHCSTTCYHGAQTFHGMLQCTVTFSIARRMALQFVEHSSLMLLFLPALLNYGSITIDANNNNDVNQHLFTCQLCKYKFTCVPFTIGTQASFCISHAKVPVKRASIWNIIPWMICMQQAGKTQGVLLVQWNHLRPHEFDCMESSNSNTSIRCITQGVIRCMKMSVNSCAELHSHKKNYCLMMHTNSILVGICGAHSISILINSIAFSFLSTNIAMTMTNTRPKNVNQITNFTTIKSSANGKSCIYGST